MKTATRRLADAELTDLYEPVVRRYFKVGAFPAEPENYGIDLFERKYSADYAAEMTRSVKAAMKAWQS